MVQIIILKYRVLLKQIALENIKQTLKHHRYIIDTSEQY